MRNDFRADCVRAARRGRWPCRARSICLSGSCRQRSHVDSAPLWRTRILGLGWTDADEHRMLEPLANHREGIYVSTSTPSAGVGAGAHHAVDDSDKDVSGVKRGIADALATIRTHAGDAEHDRRLPDEVVGALRRTGINRLLLPVELGGMDAPVADIIDIVGQLATADGSTAWYACIGAGRNLFAGYLPPTVPAGSSPIAIRAAPRCSHLPGRSPMTGTDTDCLDGGRSRATACTASGSASARCTPTILESRLHCASCSCPLPRSASRTPGSPRAYGPPAAIRSQ